MLEKEEFIREFVEEALIHIGTVEDNLLRLEGEELDMDLVNDIFRAVHNIKGTAGFFGLENIVNLSHMMENIFGEVRTGNLELTTNMIDGLLGANDYLLYMVEHVEESQEMDISSYMERLEGFLHGKEYGEQYAEEENDIDVDTLAESLKHGHRIYIIQLGEKEPSRENLLPIATSIGNIIESSGVHDMDHVIHDNTEFIFTTVLERELVAQALDIPVSNIEELDGDLSIDEIRELLGEYHKRDIQEYEEGPSTHIDTEDGVKPKKPSPHMFADDSIRVHVDLLNELMNLASELVLGRNQLLRSMEGRIREVDGLDNILQNIDHITTQMQEKIMQVRMQPVGNVFNKFPRIVRDISKELGKQIDLTMAGVDVELDKSIIESLADPLTHLVRNAIDHGIEMPKIREQLGKSKIGRVWLKAYHEGGHVTVDIEDDGAGIDVDNIGEKAVEEGLVSEDEVQAMSDSELLSFLFTPGFSTASVVTDVSGRGVGLDVVKTNIENLGGNIEIFTSKGEGTTFRLTLPLTLAIVTAIIVEVHGQRFALPQINVQELVRVKPGDDRRSIEYINESPVLRLGDKLLPLVYLADVLGLPRKDMDERDGIDNIVRVIVLKLGSKVFGLVVDSIYDDEEILVKPLPKHIKDCKCYSGVTIMGDGSIALILDPQGLSEMADLKLIDDDDREIEHKDVEPGADETSHELLLFKASGPETLAVFLSQIARVEELEDNGIETIGGREYISYRGKPLMIIRLEDYLPIQRQDTRGDKSYLLIPKYSGESVGILIERIYDTVLSHKDIDNDDIKGPGLYGSTLIDDRIVLVVSIEEVVDMASLYERGDSK